MQIEQIKSLVNVADELDNEELNKIASKVIQGFELDEDSRTDWQDRVDKAMEIAKQTMETKNHPFPDASNVKYPLITQAAIDFAARTYPEIIQNDRVVQVSVVGSDPQFKKADKARRISRHMSYQLIKANEEWEDGVDKLLHILPILGTVFKKTYFNVVEKRIVSELCNPDKIVVNYGVQSLEKAPRITHIIQSSSNDILERMRSGLYLDFDIEELKSADGYNENDEDAPLCLLEQHCYLDLDDDGYKEPYVVTVHKGSRRILRIVHRFKDVKLNDKKQVIRIDPELYFTDFHFIRSPDGGFYSVGLGSLLYPLNEAINTLINQLIDAGTLNNTQGGFLGKGLRLKNGEFNLKLGEWRVLDAAAGTNLVQNVVPLPTKEPSPTLFNLLGLLIEVGKDLVSAHDVMQGKGQTQNVAATTILAMVEQGMKVYNAISKRMYRSLKKEFRRIFELNRRFGNPNEYRNILDDPAANLREDYNEEGYDVCPVADPAMSSDAQRMAKAQAVISVPTVNPEVATKYYLRALQFDEEQIQELVPPKDPNAPPPPEVLKVLAEIDKLDAEAKRALVEAEVLSEKQLIDMQKIQLQEKDTMARADEAAARIAKMKQDAIQGAAKLELAGATADQEAALKEQEALHQREKDMIELSVKAVDVMHKAKKEKKEEKPKGDRD